MKGSQGVIPEDEYMPASARSKESHRKKPTIQLKEITISHVTLSVFYVCDVNQESLYGVIAFDKNSQRKKVKREGFKKPTDTAERMTQIGVVDIKERKKALKH